MISVKDVIKKSFLESGIFTGGNFQETLLSVAIAITVAALMGILIYVFYKKTYQGVIYSQSYGITLVGMCIFTCMITVAISTNVLLSLGMVGALSIVRYRTAIKEPSDLLYMFWSISSGIAIGAQAYLLTFFTALLFMIIMLILTRKKRRHYLYIMIVHYQGDEAEEAIKKEMNQVKYNMKSKVLRGPLTELTLEVRVKNNNFSFAERLRQIEQVEDLTLIQYHGEYYA